jgi:hypothetical protein
MINHAVAINGLLWCEFYGSLIILITGDGILKIIGICTEVEN